jgi:Asp-tRNA(Asn)/Glu-tRNA(Gln) amidotransferase A subunit family amidase
MSNTKSPLAGARFAVKDLFDIEGLRLTVGCRTWYDLSGPAQAAASALQVLLDGDANLLGTLKLGSLHGRKATRVGKSFRGIQSKGRWLSVRLEW